jgi:hypothetical protein
LLLHAWNDDVVLVGNVADDLLQHVLERDQTHDLAILVDHQREVRLAAPERLELLGKRTDVGHEPRRQRKSPRRRSWCRPVLLLERAQQILGVQNADNVFRGFRATAACG